MKCRILEVQCENGKNWRNLVVMQGGWLKGGRCNWPVEGRKGLVRGETNWKMNSTEETGEMWSPPQDCSMTAWILWVGSWLYRDRNDIDSSCVFWCMLFKEEKKTILYISLLVVRWHSLRNITHGGYWGTWAIEAFWPESNLTSQYLSG